jgi:hypothetical protein
MAMASSRWQQSEMSVATGRAWQCAAPVEVGGPGGHGGDFAWTSESWPACKLKVGCTERERYGGCGATSARHRPAHVEWKTEQGEPLRQMG